MEWFLKKILIKNSYISPRYDSIALSHTVWQNRTIILNTGLDTDSTFWSIKTSLSNGLVVIVFNGKFQTSHIKNKSVIWRRQFFSENFSRVPRTDRPKTVLNIGPWNPQLLFGNQNPKKFPEWFDQNLSQQTTTECHHWTLLLRFQAAIYTFPGIHGLFLDAISFLTVKPLALRRKFLISMPLTPRWWKVLEKYSQQGILFQRPKHLRQFHWICWLLWSSMFCQAARFHRMIDGKSFEQRLIEPMRPMKAVAQVIWALEIKLVVHRARTVRWALTNVRRKIIPTILTCISKTHLALKLHINSYWIYYIVFIIYSEIIILFIENSFVVVRHLWWSL